jgi:hypothetical protein
LFFLLIALSLVVESGFNIDGQDYFDVAREEIVQGLSDSFNEAALTEAEKQQIGEESKERGLMMVEYAQRFPSMTVLLFVLVMSGVLYIFFRKSPNIPNLRFSELLVALVYTTDMFTIYNIVIEFFNVNTVVQYVAMLLPIIPLKQMSGFSWWRILLIMLFLIVVVFAFFVLLGIIISLCALLKQ